MQIEYTSTDVDYITSILNIPNTAPAQADLAIIFGTRYPEPAAIAAELYHAGIVPHIVLTGGINKHTGMVESHQHHAILLTMDVPATALIVEDTSTNTHENVTYALAQLVHRVDLDAVQNVVVIAKWFHARRAIMTLKANFPPDIRYYAQTYAPEDIQPTNWHLDDYKTHYVLKNWRSIPIYLARGHLEEVTFDGTAFS